jgi:hypothetical protein
MLNCRVILLLICRIPVMYFPRLEPCIMEERDVNKYKEDIILSSYYFYSYAPPPPTPPPFGISPSVSNFQHRLL